MARQLGMNCQRGQLDAVETMFVADGKDIAEGRAVKQTAADTVSAVSAKADKVYGIAGGKRAGVGVAVVRSGKCWAEAAANCTPALTAPAYIDDEGKITHEGDDASLVGYFTSLEVATNGIQNVPTFTDQVKCVQIFVDL